MKLEITKNTITDGIKKLLKSNGDKMDLAVKRGLEAIRSATLPHTPRISGTLIRSYAGQSNPITGEKQGILETEQTKFLGYTTKVIGKIGSKVPYAPYVEFGTSRFSGRYCLTQGLEDSRDNVRKIIINTMKS